MHKYTTKPYIIKHWNEIRRSTYKRDREWNFIRDLVGSDYNLHTAFWRCYEGFTFYSVKPLREVPMGGYLFPVDLFVEEIV